MKAVMLAAGRGIRLGADHPKGFVTVGGRSLVERSLDHLASIGFHQISFVVGYRKERYLALDGGHAFIDNAAYASTNTLHSLMLAHAVLQDDLLILESDLLYERRGLEALVNCSAPNTVLLGGAGSADGLMTGLSKTASALQGPPSGEYVGMAKFSRPLLDDLAEYVRQKPNACYDSDGLVDMLERHPVTAVLVSDLIWCEVDDAAQLKRCMEVIYPKLRSIGAAD